MLLTLVIPDLIWPEPDDADALAGDPAPALATLLARAHATRAPRQATEPLLAARHGLPDPAPLAALRLAGEGLAPGEAGWLAADPVHLYFHQDRIVLASPEDGDEALAIAPDEADALIAALNAHAAEIGTFCAPSPARWYLRPAPETAARLAAHPFAAPPARAMAGRRVDRQVPEGSEFAWLRRFLNEAQMLLHAHPVNERRAARGARPINSLWLWGAGALPATPPSADLPDSHLLADDALLRALGAHGGLPVGGAPATFGALPAGGRPLVVLDPLAAPARREDPLAWRAALAALDTAWFAPALAALRRGGLRRLELIAPSAYGTLGWTLGPRDTWRIWQRPRPLAALARQLAETPA